MNKKIIYSLIALAVIFFITSLFIFIHSNREAKKVQDQPLMQDQNGKEISEPTSLSVKTFFFAEHTRFMLPVEHELQLSPIKENNYKNFIRILLKGQENYITPVPEGVELKTLYLIEKQGMLVLDFTEDLVSKFPSGTESELEFIYFFVNNICYNFKEIKKVKFLISGNEYQTLSGHIDMELPFYPNYNYIRDVDSAGDEEE